MVNVCRQNTSEEDFDEGHSLGSGENQRDFLGMLCC